MKLPDANVLLYARWITRRRVIPVPRRGWTPALSGSEEVGFAWVVLLAVLRLTTKPAVFAHPLRPDEAFDIVEGWLAQPCSLVPHPTVRHTALMRGFLHRPPARPGNLTTDAHLAALSVEYGADGVLRRHRLHPLSRRYACRP